MNLVRKTILFQGYYYLVTGVWPIISMASFMAVTGPKTDIWLVKTLSFQIIAMGIIFCRGSLSTVFNQQTVLLSVLSSSAFIIADVYYVIKGVLDPIYLADALIEVVILFIITGYLIFRNKIEREERV